MKTCLDCAMAPFRFRSAVIFYLHCMKIETAPLIFLKHILKCITHCLLGHNTNFPMQIHERCTAFYKSFDRFSPLSPLHSYFIALYEHQNEDCLRALLSSLLLETFYYSLCFCANKSISLN